MLTYKALISYLFRCFDLAVVIGCAIFLFRRWGAAAVRQEMKAEDEARQRLAQQIQENVKRAEQLDRALLNDYQRVMRLEKQVAQWNLASEEAKALHEEEKRKAVERLKTLHDKRVAYIEQDAYHKKIVPEAFNQAEKELRQEFDDAQRAKDFASKIIAMIQKESA